MSASSEHKHNALAADYSDDSTRNLQQMYSDLLTTRQRTPPHLTVVKSVDSVFMVPSGSRNINKNANSFANRLYKHHMAC